MTKVEINTPIVNNGATTVIISPLTAEALGSQVHEVLEQQQYKKGRYKKNMVIIDIGANMGLSALYFKDYAKKIYAIEPSIPHYTALVENTKDYPNIQCYNLAIVDHDGEITISSHDSGTIPESVYGNGAVKETVECMTLSSFMKKVGIKDVDLLKIDCEGGEFPIFMSPDFAEIAPRIKRIIGEAHFFDPFIPQYVKPILEDLGFKVNFIKGMDNIYKELVVTWKGTDLKKSYRVYFDTLFEARRA